MKWPLKQGVWTCKPPIHSILYEKLTRNRRGAISNNTCSYRWPCEIVIVFSFLLRLYSYNIFLNSEMQVYENVAKLRNITAAVIQFKYLHRRLMSERTKDTLSFHDNIILMISTNNLLRWKREFNAFFKFSRRTRAKQTICYTVWVKKLRISV